MTTGTAATVVLHGTAMDPFAPWFLTSVRAYWAMCQALPPAPETQPKWNRCCFCTWKTVNLVDLPSCHPTVIIYWLSTFSVPGKALHISQLHPHGEGWGRWLMVPIWQMRKPGYGKDEQLVQGFMTSKWDRLASDSADSASVHSDPFATLPTASVLENFCQTEMRKVSGSRSRLQCPYRKPRGLGTKKPEWGRKPSKERKITVPKQQGGLAWWKIITWAIMYISTSRKY